MPPEVLSKLEVARRQLVAAIRLLFEARDVVSVYSLATNAQEVLSTLCEKKNVRSLRQFIAAPAGMSVEDVQQKLINRARNFFKHADWDPDGILSDFQEEDCDSVLLIACFDLIELEKKSPVEVQVFLAWYGALYPEKFPPEFEIVRAGERKFPGLRAKSRREQKRAGKWMIEKALGS